MYTSLLSILLISELERHTAPSWLHLLVPRQGARAFPLHLKQDCSQGSHAEQKILCHFKTVDSSRVFDELTLGTGSSATGWCRCSTACEVFSSASICFFKAPSYTIAQSPSGFSLSSPRKLIGEKKKSNGKLCSWSAKSLVDRAALRPGGLKAVVLTGKLPWSDQIGIIEQPVTSKRALLKAHYSCYA